MFNYLPGLEHFFQTLATNIFLCPRYPLVLMVVSESTLGFLSEKHNFDLEGTQGGTWKWQKSKKIDFIVVSGNDF